LKKVRRCSNSNKINIGLMQQLYIRQQTPWIPL
jgi:hypothetical protein